MRCPLESVFPQLQCTAVPSQRVFDSHLQLETVCLALGLSFSFLCLWFQVHGCPSLVENSIANLE